MENSHYVALQPDARGWLWSNTFQLWLGMQEGHFQGTTAIWLRFFTSTGALVPTGEETAAAERARADAAEAENARLRAELERLRSATPECGQFLAAGGMKGTEHGAGVTR